MVNSFHESEIESVPEAYSESEHLEQFTVKAESHKEIPEPIAGSADWSRGCPYKFDNAMIGEFQRNMIFDRERHCGANYSPAIQSEEQFGKAYFGFRDNTQEMSHKNDTAMRVQDIYLSSNTDIVDKFYGKSFKDIHNLACHQI